MPLNKVSTLYCDPSDNHYFLFILLSLANCSTVCSK